MWALFGPRVVFACQLCRAVRCKCVWLIGQNVYASSQYASNDKMSSLFWSVRTRVSASCLRISSVWATRSASLRRDTWIEKAPPQATSASSGPPKKEKQRRVYQANVWKESKKSQTASFWLILIPFGVFHELFVYCGPVGSGVFQSSSSSLQQKSSQSACCEVLWCNHGGVEDPWLLSADFLTSYFLGLVSVPEHLNHMRREMLWRYYLGQVWPFEGLFSGPSRGYYLGQGHFSLFLVVSSDFCTFNYHFVFSLPCYQAILSHERFSEIVCQDCFVKFPCFEFNFEKLSVLLR